MSNLTESIQWLFLTYPLTLSYAVKSVLELTKCHPTVFLFFFKSYLAACLETWLQLKVEPYRAVAKFHFSVGLYCDD